MAPAALLPIPVESTTTTTPPLPLPTTAPTVIGPTTKKATRPTRPLPRSLIENARIADSEKVPFTPSVHLAYSPPSKIHKMADFGLEGAGISPNAISEPFPLFTPEAIRQMRGEIFSEAVLEHCRFSSSFCANMIRGMGHARAPFIYDVWKSPDVLSKISAAAGIDLIPAFDYEIANINVAVRDDDDGIDTSTNTTNLAVKNVSEDNDVPAFAWHYDSFPFVCVIMLSDCSGMVGGETAIRLPDGSVKKVRGPAQGYAVVMQGRYLEHQALKALGGRERITMVTPFRPRDANVRDEVLLVGTRGISDLGEMYPQYFEYRMEVLEERVRGIIRRERERGRSGRGFDVEGVRGWIEEQREFLDSMLREMVVVE
ncbi:hypothetical protein BJX68DRAFT_251870 [Aspergillus pseudodeflectus]|uniref:Fe2OG dioxygenase domain-containing protein n=1 Tax=Aspergillus pseudodeflectus TaxID=176178 RepID=A0ABR4L6C0_9EURO